MVEILKAGHAVADDLRIVLQGIQTKFLPGQRDALAGGRVELIKLSADIGNIRVLFCPENTEKLFRGFQGIIAPGSDPSQMKAILDMGPDGVIFPFTNNPKIAREGIQACLYPDQGGVRGQGPIRAIRYGLDEEGAYIANAAASVFKVGQIETLEGYENLDAILDVKGFDSFFIGRADLGRSIAGSKKQVNLDQAFTDICRRVREKGYYMGAAIGASAAEAEDAKSRGVQWVVFGQDVKILAEGLKRNLENLKEL